jgi:hypothetical protein
MPQYVIERTIPGAREFTGQELVAQVAAAIDPTTAEG